MLTLSLAGKTYDLEPGDAAHFDSRQPHRLIARGRRDAEVLLVASPVSSASGAFQNFQAAAGQNRAIPPMGLMNFIAAASSRPAKTKFADSPKPSRQPKK